MEQGGIKLSSPSSLPSVRTVGKGEGRKQFIKISTTTTITLAEMIFFSVAAYARTGRGRAYAFLSLSIGEIKAKKCERVGDWRASRLDGICLEVE